MNAERLYRRSLRRVKANPESREAWSPCHFARASKAVILVLERKIASRLGGWRRISMPTFFIEQFGCRATQADGAALERQLLQRGCTSVRESAAADFVVVNTCTVTASADTQARDAIRKLHSANPKVR